LKEVLASMREPRDRTTGLDADDVDHYSWQEVYAACEVEGWDHD
jgi:hypothetical protein